MEYILDNFQKIETFKTSDKDEISKNLLNGSIIYIQSIQDKVYSLNDLQSRIMLTTEVDKLFKTYINLKKCNLKNVIFKAMYINSYFKTYKKLEIIYRPHVKEAFKEAYEFWDFEKTKFDNAIWEGMQKAKENKDFTKKNQKKIKKSNWEYVIELIVKGEITIEVINKYDKKYILNKKEYKNITQLGNQISSEINVKGDFRPYLSDILNNNTNGKNPFSKKNIEKIEKIISENGNKMCPFFKEIYAKLISPQN